MTDSEEFPLSGGTLNRVVRIGGTVRRPASPWSGAVQALLGHLRSSGFDLAPEPLGFDGAGREIVSWIDGQTVGWSLPWPPSVRSASLLQAVARAAAALHQAAAGFEPPPGTAWQDDPAAAATTASRRWHTVCHNDLAPYNVVLRDGALAGIIDWDQAGPGDPVWDLAFVAWQWVPLHGPAVASLMGWEQPPDRAGRLRLLLDAYGLEDRNGFVATVAERIRYNRAVMVSRAEAGDAAYRALVDQGHLFGMDEALAALDADGDRLQAAL